MILEFWNRRAALAARDRANAANRAGLWAQAVPDYRRYLAWNPDDFAIWVQLGHMLAESGDYAGSDRIYAIAEGLKSDDADLFLCWGHLHSRNGEIELARRQYRRSAELDGNMHAIASLQALAEPLPADMQASDPEPETIIEVEAEPDPTPLPIAGCIERVEGNAVLGWALLGNAVQQEDVEFRCGSEVVGRTPLIHPDQGRSNFAAVLDLVGEFSISAHRRSDGTELEGSPFVLRFSPPSVPPASPAWAVPIEVAKPFTITQPTTTEVALFVTHSATGLLKPHVLPYLRALHAEGIAILFVAVVDQPTELPDDLLHIVAGALIRANRGYDFAAWAHALKLHPELYAAARLYFVNDSMFGPADAGSFKQMVAQIRNSDADLVGLTESRERGWHVQSYFFAARQQLLATLQFQTFFEDVKLLDSKDAVIQAYEIPLGTMLRSIGCSIDILFPVPIAINPTLFAWPALLAAGFPFIKLLLVRGLFPEADLRDWRARLEAAGFDLPLLDLTIRACNETLPQGSSPGLIAQGSKAARVPTPDGEPLKVAFFGPWNYDSGLAAASRGLIGALRRTGVRLNLHPIRRPFHVHRPFTPPADICDFAGTADIAIVHLNPDSWHLLTPDQLDLVRGARLRIGYWVWEMGHIPAAWWADFRSVDRIWSPSRYCADLFAAHTDVPVDVIPHAVPVLPHAPADRAEVMADLGLSSGDRIVLYVFDGASYLVRKNPASLVRAFAASGLGQRGWKLVLKTKHLMDRPADGAAFRDFATSIEGVVLVDRSLTPASLRALVQIADIYASSHCSEGFGLTIAEAMAAGRPVVATDFGGSRDFLDSSSGYPVRAHPWTLDEDYSHYTAGGSWARVDEPSLAATLVRAAEAAEAGNTTIGDAGRARIAGQLSYEAIGRLIEESFTAVTSPSASALPRPIEFHRFRTSIHAGLPLDRAEFNPRFAVIPLTRDGAAQPGALGLPDGALPNQHHWVIIAPECAQLHPLLPKIVDEQARDRPDVAIFYGDDAANLTDNACDQIRLKPAFDLALLAAQDYIGAPLIVRASTFAALGGLRLEAGTAAGFDLVLRAHAAGLSIERIEEVLAAFHDERVFARPEDRRRVLAEQSFAAPYDIVPGRVANALMLRRRFSTDADKPLVTLLIPTCRSSSGNGAAHVECLLDRIAHTDWPMDRLQVLIGDDIIGAPAWAESEWPFHLKRIETPRPAGEPFNYSRKMNDLWRRAGSDYVVFLNDDLRPEGSNWLSALMTFAMDEGVGGVGARLLYEDGRLQHAGIVPHLRGVCHAWLSRRPEQGSYQDWADVHREWSMITGAVFATRRSILSEVGGFDEQFALEYNDVDLCLRIRALGYRMVVTPDAEMIHVEKASRGPGHPRGSELARFLTRWQAWLAADPAFHPKLRQTDTFDLLPQDDPSAWYRL